MRPSHFILIEKFTSCCYNYIVLKCGSHRVMHPAAHRVIFAVNCLSRIHIHQEAVP
jgi:hypothetical protein